MSSRGLVQASYDAKECALATSRPKGIKNDFIESSYLESNCLICNIVNRVNCLNVTVSSLAF